jgi:filamentous hemagglutinin family protein
MTIISSLLKASCLTFSSLIICTPAWAQIAPDGTTPSTTVTTPDGSNFTIEQGDRPEGGGNLFHSFREFSVPTGGSASFNNAPDVQNIINRVTGGSVSNIDGLIRANGSANLFLLNPAGIVFGPNASLNIGGSFFGSTADSLVFPEGEFSATDTQTPPLLTVNAPIGLNFRDNPEPITNSSRVNNGNGLQVNTGKNITLIGGNINFDGGRIFAPGGNVELGGLSAAGEIGINSNSSLNFPDGVARGNVSLQNGSGVFVLAGGGGNITVNARNFELQSSVFLAGIGSGLGSPDARAGDININATDNISIDGQGSNFTAISNSVLFNNSLGNAGKINISARNISLTNGGQINSAVAGRGNSSDITLNARENVFIDGSNDSFNSVVGSFVSGVGNSGSTNITAQNLILTNGGQIQSLVAGVGNSGDINLDVKNSISVDGEAIFPIGTIPSQINSNIAFDASGNSGDINITTSKLSLTNGGLILVDTFGIGNAGNIDITATESITLNGRSSQGGSFSGISSEVLNAVGNGGNIQIFTGDFSVSNNAKVDTSTGGRGNGGKINITATNLSLTNGGDINAITSGSDASNIAQGNAGDITINVTDTLSINGTSFLNSQGQSVETPAGIFASNQGNSIGNAGNIDITASKLSLSNGSQINSFTRGRGNAGSITINARDSVLLDAGNESEVATLISTGIEEGGVGNGGEINIDTNNLSILNGAAIQNTTSGEGNAGNTTINARDSIFLSGKDREDFSSGIFSSVTETAIGNGGKIGITTNNLDIFDGAAISARSVGRGNGGNIFIQANSLSLDKDSVILADTSFGRGGNIQLQIADTIFLRNNSSISARATSDADGGNIDINAGFVIAYPSQVPNDGNDIIASAERGRGGKIDIDTQQIFGLQERRATPGNGTNDIDASSEFGLSGEVVITNLVDDINQGVVESPDNVVEPEAVTAQACPAAGRVAKGESSFTITGRGGLPALATDPLTSDQIRIGGDDATPNSQKSSRGVVTVIEQPNPPSSEDIVPARGMIVNEKGEIVLTAYPTPNASQRIPNKLGSCGAAAPAKQDRFREN